MNFLSFHPSTTSLVLILLVALFVLWLRLVVGPLLRLVMILAKEAWRARAALNPLTPTGAWRLLGLASLAAGAGCLVAQRRLQVASVWWLAAGPVLLLGLIFLAHFCFSRAHRHDAPTQSRTSAATPDSRPPVLYLRSFQDDATAARALGLRDLKLTTEEDEIARILSPVGPMVAVGRPGEVLSFSGATRVYLDEGEWRRQVELWLAQAALVVIRIGDTAGVWWEIEHTVGIANPERLVLLLPFGKRRYEEFRRRAAQVFPRTLPEYKGRRIPSTTIRAVMVFDADWTARTWAVRQTHREYWLYALADLLANLSLSRNNLIERRSSRLGLVLADTLAPVLSRVRVG